MLPGINCGLMTSTLTTLQQHDETDLKYNSFTVNYHHYEG